MKKIELRTQFKKRRNELSDQQIVDRDAMIFEQLTNFDWSNFKYLHCYLAIAKFKEYDTMKFIHWIWKNHPTIKIIISKSDFNTHLLKHYVFDAETTLEYNSWGIPEPINAVEINVQEIDVVLAPLLVVDQMGNRIGYGKGFYDRFFASCKKEVLKAGISYFEPITKIEDVETWDVPISVVFTPENIYFL